MILKDGGLMRKGFENPFITQSWRDYGRRLHRGVDPVAHEIGISGDQNLVECLQRDFQLMA